MRKSTIRCVILGGGGHARVVIDSLLASRAAVPHAVLDSAPSMWGTELMGVPIRGGDELILKLAQEGVTHFVVGLGGVGDNQPRREVFERVQALGLTPLTVAHPSAICSRLASVGPGSLLGPGAVVNVGAVLGVGVIVNSGAIVEHDDILGDYVHIASGACLASTVRVGAGAHVGAGAVVRQGLSIGEGAIVGAGAVVIEPVAPWTVAVGVPAKFLREVNRPPGTKVQHRMAA